MALETGFARPTLAALKTRIKADLVARLKQDEVLRRADLEVQAAVQAAAVNSLYGFIDYVAEQILPDTAGAESLDRHGSIWGVVRKAASKAVGTVTLTTTVGAAVPSGAELVHASGLTFVVTAGVTATGTSTAVATEATAAGAAGNLAAGEPLTLISPIVGVQSVGASGTLAGGADVESDDALRARILDRIRQPPHGGADFDYRAWALEVAGVTRAWVLPQHFGVGTVGITFVMDDRADIVPTAGDVSLVQAHIDEVRPVTADAQVFAPGTLAVDLTVEVSPDTPEVRAAIEAEVDDFLRREAAPGGTIYLSRLREAVSQAAGETHHEMTAPTANIVLPAGTIAILGTITWV